MPLCFISSFLQNTFGFLIFVIYRVLFLLFSCTSLSMISTEIRSLTHQSSFLFFTCTFLPDSSIKICPKANQSFFLVFKRPSLPTFTIEVCFKSMRAFLPRSQLQLFNLFLCTLLQTMLAEIRFETYYKFFCSFYAFFVHDLYRNLLVSTLEVSTALCFNLNANILHQNLFLSSVELIFFLYMHFPALFSIEICFKAQ